MGHTLLPKTLCVIHDDREYTEFLVQYLQNQGVAVTRYLDSNEALASEGVFDHGFYVVDLKLPGIDGLDVVRLLRRRTDADVIVVSGKVGDTVFDEVLNTGARVVQATAPLRRRVAISASL